MWNGFIDFLFAALPWGDCPDRGGCPTVGAVWNSNSEAKSRLLERDR